MTRKRFRLPPIQVLQAGVLALFVAGPVGPVLASEESRQRLEDEQNTVDVVRQAASSVVAVQVSGVREQGGIPTEGQQQPAGGSGFVVDDAGHIITNFHVVALAFSDSEDDADLELAEGASITVSYLNTPDDQYEARVLGANPDFDFALLELIEQDERPDIAPLPLADSDLVEVGEKAIAIGNPFGLNSSVTTGIVSAVERERPGIVGIEIPYIQTDAAINPGNSGGPLLNSAGEVTGINNAILSPGGTFAGVGLAVPSNLLKEALSDMLEGGLSGFAAVAAELPERPRLGLQVGLTVSDYPPQLREELGFPEQGVVVTEVSPGGAAAEAGIQGPTDAVMFGPRPLPVGMDIIIAVDGNTVSRAVDIQRIILERGEGDVVTLRLWREGNEREVDVPLEVVEVQD